MSEEPAIYHIGKTVPEAVRDGNSLEQIKELVASGADPDDFLDEYPQQTALHLAATYDDFNIVEYLIGLNKPGEEVVWIDNWDDERHTPLDLAGSDKMRDLLRSHGCSTAAEVDESISQAYATQKGIELLIGYKPSSQQETVRRII